LWAVARELKIPLDLDLKQIRELPYTISYVVRKRIQIDNLNQLPEEKRPPENVLWHSNPDKLDEWLDKTLNKKEKKVIPQDTIVFPLGDVE
jgi:hypothetical protein